MQGSQAPGVRLHPSEYRYFTAAQIVREFNRGRTIASIAGDVFRAGQFTKKQYATHYVSRVIYEHITGTGEKNSLGLPFD